MKKTVVVLMSVVAFLVVALASAEEDISKRKAFFGGSGGGSGKRWEYKVEELRITSDQQKELNKQGSFGWELVTVAPETKDYPGTRSYAYFKREVM